MAQLYRSSQTTSLFWPLAISVACNVALLSYLLVQDGVLWLEVETVEPKIPSGFVCQSESLSQKLAQLSSKTDDELIMALADETAVANGYTVQELALALLKQRGLAVEDPLRALGAWPQGTTPFCYQEGDSASKTVFLFSSVSSKQIRAVQTYIQETAVPYTAIGMVDRLSTAVDLAVLKEALFRTDEWHIFRSLLQPLSDEQAASFAQDVGGDVFTAITEWGKSHPKEHDLGRLLLYVFKKHPSARLADVIAHQYADVVIQQAPDDTVVLLYAHLPHSESGARLALRMLQGQRRPYVWKASQAYLAKLSGSQEMMTMNRDQLLAWFRQPSKIKAEPVTPLSTSPVETIASVPERAAARQLQPFKTYVVKKGDSLWSLSRRFGISVEKLKLFNGIKSDALSPGTELKIPH